MGLSHLLPPRDEPALRRLCAADLLDAMADQVMLLALPAIALLLLDASARDAAILTATQWAPSLLLSGVLGVAVDRVGRRAVMVGSAAVSAGSAALLIWIPWCPQPLQLAGLLVVGVLYAGSSVAYNIASAAAGPRSVVSLPVADALAYQSATVSTGRILGQATAGPAVQVLGGIGGAAAAIVLSLGKLAAAACWRVASDASPMASDDNPGRPDGRGAWRWIWDHPLLRVLSIGAFAMNIGLSAFEGCYFAFVLRDLARSPLEVSLLLWIGAVSAIVGAYLARRWQASLGARSLCVLGAVVGILGAWLLPAAAFGLPVLASLVAYECLWGIGLTLFTVNFAVLRQRWVPDALLGQVIATSTTLNAFAVLTGLGCVTAIVDDLGLTGTIVAGSACATVGAGVLVAAVAIRPDTAPTAPPSSPPCR